MPRPAARLLFALWTLALVAAMLTPASRLPREALFSYDKLLHLSAFAVWAMLAVRASAHARGTVVPIVIGGLCLAVATEVAQETIPLLRRNGEVADGAADLLGVAVGLTGVWAWRRARAARRRAASTVESRRRRPS